MPGEPRRSTAPIVDSRTHRSHGRWPRVHGLSPKSSNIKTYEGSCGDGLNLRSRRSQCGRSAPAVNASSEAFQTRGVSRSMKHGLMGLWITAGPRCLGLRRASAVEQPAAAVPPRCVAAVHSTSRPLSCVEHWRIVPKSVPRRAAPNRANPRGSYSNRFSEGLHL